MNSDIQRYRYRSDPVLKQIVNLIFWSLATVILLHLEGLFNRDGIEKIILYAIILAISVLLVCIVHVRIECGLGVSGIILLATIMSYLAIGFIVAVARGIELSMSDYIVAGSISFFMVIVIAAALGGYATMEEYGIETTFVWILGFLIITCIVIAVSPVERTFARHTGLFVLPHDAGLTGCLTVVMAISFLRSSKRKWLALSALTAGLIAILTTVSKTSMITALFIIFYVAFFGGVRVKLFLVLSIGLIGLIFIFFQEDIIGYFAPIFLKRFGPLVSHVYVHTSDSDILTGRGILWEIGIQRILESPIVGYGFSQAHHLKEAPFIPEGGGRYGVHNMYLMMMIDAGIVPLFLYFLYLSSIFHLLSFFPTSVARDTIAGWTIVLMLAGISDHHLFTVKILAFVIGLSCATIQFLNISRSEKNP